MQPTNENNNNAIVKEESNIVQDLTAGVLTGLNKAATSTVELALDTANYLDNKFLNDKMSDVSVAQWKDKMSFENEILSITGADKDSTTYGISSGLVEGTAIALQVMSGVGSLSAGAKLSSLAKGAGLIPSLKGLSSGTKAVTSGSKVAKTAKLAGVGAVEEFRASTSGDGGGIISSLAEVTGLYERDSAKVQETQEQYLQGLASKDPELYEDAVAYLAANPKAELDPLKRMTNRFKAGVEGAVAGPAIEKAGGAFINLIKKFKTFNYGKNVVSDTVEKAKIADEALSGEGPIKVEGKTPKQINDEIAKKVKSERILRNEKVNDKYFEDYSKYKEFEIDVEMSNKNFDRVNDKLVSGGTITKKDKDVVREEVRNIFGITEANAAKRKALADLEERPLEELLTDKEFVTTFQKEIQASDQKLTQITEEINKDIGLINFKIAKGEATENDFTAMFRMKQLQRGIEKRKGASASLAGQQLRLAGIDKANSTAELNRLSAFYKRKNNIKMGEENAEYFEFMGKIHSDPAFRKEFSKKIGAKDEIINRVLTIEDKLNNLWKKQLLLATKGIFRNVTEGIGLTSLKAGEDELADVFSNLTKNSRKVGTTTKAYLKTLSDSENWKQSFNAMVTAFKGGDMELAAKVGGSFIEDKGIFNAVMSMGQRGIVAFDAPLKIMNEAVYISKEASHIVNQTLKDESALESTMSKFLAGKTLTAQESTILNTVTGQGIQPKEFMDKFNDLSFAQFHDWYKGKIVDSPALAKEANKFSNAIAMNKDYSEMGVVARGLSKVIDPMSRVPFIRVLAPFPKPALSALDTALEWSPFVNSADTLKTLLNKGASARDKQKAIARFSMSSSAGAVLWNMLSSGDIVGEGPDHYKDRGSAREAGFKAHTIRIGNDNFSMQGSIFGGFVSSVDKVRKIHLNSLAVSDEAVNQSSNLMTGVLGIMADLPHDFYTNTFGNFIKTIDLLRNPDNVANQAAASQMALTLGFKRIPLVGSTAAKDIRYAADDTLRDTSTTLSGIFGVADRMVNEAINSIPALSESLPAKRSYFTGEKLKHGKNGALPMTYLENNDHEFVDYIRKLLPVSQRSKDPVLKNNDLSFTAPIRSINITGLGSYKLESDEYEKLTMMTSKPRGASKSLYQEIKSYMNRPENSLDRIEAMSRNGGAAKMRVMSQIREIIAKYKKAGREQFKATSPEFKAWLQETSMRQQDFARQRAQGTTI